ncbi:MAG: TonB family protein [Myxococcota bacterium]
MTPTVCLLAALAQNVSLTSSVGGAGNSGDSKILDRLRDDCLESTLCRSAISAVTYVVEAVIALGRLLEEPSDPLPAAPTSQAEFDTLMRARIHKISGQLDRCYAIARANDNEASGRVMVSFTIAKDGTVSRSRIAKTSIDDEEMLACILDQVDSTVFPKPIGYPTSFTLPLVFRLQ